MSQAKGKSQASKARHLKNSLEYILNPEKTEMGTLTGGSHVLPDADFAFEKMLETKRTMEEKYGRKKTEGRQGYHFVLSFSPKDNVTPKMAMEITKKFIEAHIPDYESVYAVHTDKEHLHSHVVFNSINMVTGLKYHSKNGDWEKIVQPITNRLCEKYGLSTINLEKLDGMDGKEKQTKNQNYGEWKEQKEKEDKKRKRKKSELVQEDIMECLKLAKSRQEFDIAMQKRGYEVHRKGETGNDLKHTAVLPPGGKRRTRLDEEQESILKALPETISRSSVNVKKTDKVQNTTTDSINHTSSGTNAAYSFSDKMDRIDDRTKTENKNNQEKSCMAPFIKSAKTNFKKSKSTDYRATVTKSDSEENHFCNIAIIRKQTIQTVFIVKTMKAAFLLDDYSKRRKGKYYQEYVKFDGIQKKMKYLHSNHINTMKQLETRLSELYSLKEKLAEQKRGIFQERKKYAEVFRLYEKMETLRMPAQLYKDGDRTFSGEYEQLKKTLETLKKSGMSVDEVKKQYDLFREKLSSMGKIEHMLKKEISLCEEIKQESIQKQMEAQKRKSYSFRQEKETNRKKERRKSKSR